ncbi:MAG: glutamate 5-kinase, partial [Myxococcales bacterium]|nr:glutamate 5-kinase [Myxococcales bacterium]
MSSRDHARSARCIVIKVGSAILAGASGVRGRVVSEIAAQVATLREQGRRVVIVSSGAIAAGSRELGWDHTGRTIPEKQAAAAVGQIGLCEIYRRRFARYGYPVGQVLVTHMGLAERERFLNARHTLTELLDLGVVPIVNENDTVATEEIRFGDNDNLSAAVVNLVGAQLLVILTDVDGLYEHPPEAGAPKPPVVAEVLQVDEQTRRRAGGSNGEFGRGGMITKLEAAERAARSGAATVLCNGRRKDAILRAAAGECIGTIIAPGTKLQSKKHWLAFTARTCGRLELDDGAIRALREGGRSLLPAGVRTVSGNFGIGDPVSCADAGGTEIARGLVAYSAADIERIRGGKAREIASVLGYSNGDEVIHRNDLVWLGNEGDG